MEKTKYIKLPPELTDGEHWTIHGAKDGAEVLGQMLLDWLDSERPGDTLTLKIVEMTDAEVEALPPI